MEKTIHDAMAAVLAGIAQYKPGTKEIIWKDPDDQAITIEHIGPGRFAVRGYYINGNLYYKDVYENGKQHGKQSTYYQTGKLWYQENFKHGLKHGIQIEYYRDNNVSWKTKYLNGKLIRRWKVLPV